jgi:hypothetical protein
MYFVLGGFGIRWENGLGGSGGYKRIFLRVRVLEIRQKIKKIRSNPPDPPNPFSHCISISTSKNIKSTSTNEVLFMFLEVLTTI